MAYPVFDGSGTFNAMSNMILAEGQRKAGRIDAAVGTGQDLLGMAAGAEELQKRSGGSFKDAFRTVAVAKMLMPVYEAQIKMGQAAEALTVQAAVAGLFGSGEKDKGATISIGALFGREEKESAKGEDGLVRPRSLKDLLTPAEKKETK